LHLFVTALVGDGDTKSLIEKGHLLESRAQGLVVKLDGFEGLGARPESDHGAGLA